MQVKVCGLREIANMKAVVQQQPDFIGMIFYPFSPRYAGDAWLLPAYCRSLKTVAKTGVFVNEKEATLLAAVEVFGLDYVQLHGNESPELCRRISRSVPVIKAFAVHADFSFRSLEAYAPYCTFFLMDTPAANHGGSGFSFDWRLLEQQDIPRPFLLAGGIGPGDAERLKQFRHPAFLGADINSCFEIKPGIKNVHLIQSFIHEIRN